MAKSIRRLKELGPLQDLLLKCCPADPKGHKSIPILARALDMTACGVYKWLSDERLPMKRAFELVELADGKVALDELLPYVLGQDAAKLLSVKKRKR